MDISSASAYPLPPPLSGSNNQRDLAVYHKFAMALFRSAPFRLFKSDMTPTPLYPGETPNSTGGSMWAQSLLLSCLYKTHSTALPHGLSLCLLFVDTRRVSLRCTPQSGSEECIRTPQNSEGGRKRFSMQLSLDEICSAAANQGGAGQGELRLVLGVGLGAAGH